MHILRIKHRNLKNALRCWSVGCLWISFTTFQLDMWIRKSLWWKTSASDSIDVYISIFCAVTHTYHSFINLALHTFISYYLFSSLPFLFLFLLYTNKWEQAFFFKISVCIFFIVFILLSIVYLKFIFVSFVYFVYLFASRWLFRNHTAVSFCARSLCLLIHSQILY